MFDGKKSFERKVDMSKIYGKFYKFLDFTQLQNIL